VSALVKLLPVAAVGIAGVTGYHGLKDNANVIDKFTVAAVEAIEMPGVAEAVAAHYIEHETLPVRNFSQFLKENLRENKGGSKRDKSADPWGTPYVLTTSPRGFSIHSAGPDKQWKTEDDLQHAYDLAGLGGVAVRPNESSGPRGQNQQQARKQPPQKKQKNPDRPSKAEIDDNVLEFQMQRAEEGSASAQYEMAMRYLTGKGVEPDLDKAMNLMRQSAGQDYTKAKRKLEQLESSMSTLESLLSE